MASPVGMFVVPNCGLDIELIGSDLAVSSYRRVRVLNRASRSNNEQLVYRITSQDIPLLTTSTSKSFTGSCSPVHEVTLPRVIKRNTGCPVNSAYYCYIHPPVNLAEEIDWTQFKIHGRDIDEDVEKENKWAIPYIALVGGFVYFDEHGNIIAVSALSMTKTPYDLKLSGPFLPTKAAVKQIRRKKRACPIILEYFYEVGFAAFAWIHPQERFNHKVLSEQIHNNHGSIMFFKEDGSAIVYCVDPTGFIDPGGETSSIADAYHQSSRVSTLMQKNVRIVTKDKFRTEEEIEKSRLAIVNITGTRGKHDFLHYVEDSRTLLHLAIKTGCDSETIQRHLDDSELLNLDHRDKFGCTPLHYACGRHPQDADLIRLLIEKCPKSALVIDQFDRYPLHIACDYHASADIIAILIEADPGMNSVQQKTKFLGRRPIHIALYGKLSKEAIECLLKADPSCVALTSKTKAGRLPLHIAIEQRLDTDVVRILLETNARDHYERRHHSERAIEMSVSLANSNNGSNAIYHPFAGMIPLHIACWNNSSPETIEALLNADFANTTVDTKVGPESFLVKNFHVLDEDEWINTKFKNKVEETDSASFGTTDDENDEENNVSTARDICASNYNEKCILPLHIACKNGRPEVIYLLLQMEINKTRGEDGLLDNINFQDNLGRTPLHIACRNSADPTIIADLLEMDYHGETTQLNDQWGFKAIHYACDRKDASKEIIQLLVQAEDRFIADRVSKGFTKIKRSTHTCEDRKRSPLCLAVKAGADEKVVEILLGPEQFFLKGFDGELISGLSSMAVKNRKIQDCIIEKLTERCYFNLLFIDVYANACALFFFLLGSEKLMRGEITYIEPLMISLCIVVFVLRQTIHLKSQTGQFFAGIWNWGAVASIILLGMSARHMADEVGNDEPIMKKRLLIVSGSFLIVQMTFFLRATFLPFARFVGGLMTIFSTLIPFFIVASLMLLAFAYGFMIQGNELCPNLLDCYAFTLQGFFSGFDDTNDILDVLFGFVAIIVLLNVVIAIVSNAWDSAAEKAISLFWRFRLEFLCEARFFAYMDKRMCHGGIVEEMGNVVDNFRAVKFVDNTPWDSSPYSQVNSKKQYDNPFDYFHSDAATKIEEAKSLTADLYWIRMDSRRKKRTRAEKRALYVIVVFKWLVLLAGYALLCLAGLFSAGWVWPKSLRKKMLAIGLSDLKPREQDLSEDNASTRSHRLKQD